MSEGAEESLSVSVSESLVLLAFLIGDFFDFVLLPCLPLSRSLLLLLSLLSFPPFLIPTVFLHPLNEV